MCVCLQMMPTVIMFSVAINCLYYWGVVQFMVNSLGGLLSFCLDTAPVESVNVVSNMFLSFVSLFIIYRHTSLKYTIN